MYEKDIPRIFFDFVNSLMKNCTTITGGLKEALVAVSDNTALEKDRDELQDECEVVMELMRNMVQANTCSAENQVDYKVKYPERCISYYSSNRSSKSTGGYTSSVPAS